MSITDELRKEARGFGRYVYTAPQADCLTAIADRIDAEHEKAEQDLIDANNQMEQLCECSIRLPVDADGEYIHVGDTLDGYGKTIEVVEMRYGRGGWVLISRDGSGYADTFAFAHRHTPTVEDVLREFWSDVDLERADGCGDFSPIIAEYAAKLRLAGEDE